MSLANRLQHASDAIEFCNSLVILIRLFFICGGVLVFVFFPETMFWFCSFHAPPLPPLLGKYSPL